MALPSKHCQLNGIGDATSRICEESQSLREELAGLRLQQDEMSAKLARFTEDGEKIGQESEGILMTKLPFCAKAWSITRERMKP
jgi:hypothetical protein